MGWACITKLDALILDEHWYMSTIVELATVLVVMHKIFTPDEVFSTANFDTIWKESNQRNSFVCLFVCFFVGWLVFVFVCMFVCLSNTGVTTCTGNCA